MGKTYYKLFYHLIWSTAMRERLIHSAWEEKLYSVLKARAAQRGCFVYACGGTEDHVHMVMSIPPRESVSAVVGAMKGASAFAANHDFHQRNGSFAWQDGFGVLTVSERDLPRVMHYVEHQKEHHQQKTLIGDWEKSSDESSEAKTAEDKGNHR